MTVATIHTSCCRARSLTSADHARAPATVHGEAARERALIVLRAWKAGERHDPSVAHTVHPRQVEDYNYYVDLLRGATGPLAHFVSVVSMLISQLERQIATLDLLLLWGMQAANVLALLLLEPGKRGDAGARTRAISILGQAPLALADAAALGVSASYSTHHVTAFGDVAND